jgi:uncharacterized RDD family membrane protein YckC
MANGEWYYAAGGQQQGPVPLESLKQMLSSGQVQPGDLVWSQGMPNWAAANTVPGLVDAAAPAAAAPGYPMTPGYAAPAPGPYANPVGYYTPTPTYMPYAGFWARFGAAFIDGLIISLPFTVVGWALAAAYGQPPFGNQNYGPGGYGTYGRGGPPTQDPVYTVLSLAINLASLVAGWLYEAMQTSGPHMATIGKRALGIRVTDIDGQRISFGRATGRHFAKILSGCTCLIGYIMAAFTERHQALHDMIAGTLVVEGKAEDAAQQQAPGQYPGQYPYPR